MAALRQAICYDGGMDSNYRILGLGLVAVVVLIGGGILYWVLSQRSVDQATQNVASNSTASTSSSSAGATNSATINTAANTAPPTLTSEATPTSTTIAPATNAFEPPIAEFTQRITKKGFGAYFTPQTSPIPGDRFTGYHTGVDVEYTDTTADVRIYAIADGHIVTARTASGYGGVMLLKFTYNGTEHLALYGHVRLSSIPPINTFVSRGQQIGVLGTGDTTETDGERHHLHFGILAGTKQDIRGYVQNKTDLSGWIDPLSLYQ